MKKTKEQRRKARKGNQARKAGDRKLEQKLEKLMGKMLPKSVTPHARIDPAMTDALEHGESYDIPSEQTPPTSGKRFIIKVQMPMAVPAAFEELQRNGHLAASLLVYNEDRSVHRFEADPEFALRVIRHLGDTQVKCFIYAEMGSEGTLHYHVEEAPWQSW